VKKSREKKTSISKSQIVRLDSPTNVPDSEPLPWFSVDYRRLYEILCQTIHTDQSTLLLYMLLHRNQHFKTYVTSRTNIDQLVKTKFSHSFCNRSIRLRLFFLTGFTDFTRDLSFK
jgi:hypothetical protein